MNPIDNLSWCTVNIFLLKPCSKLLKCRKSTLQEQENCRHNHDSSPTGAVHHAQREERVNDRSGITGWVGSKWVYWVTGSEGLVYPFFKWVAQSQPAPDAGEPDPSCLT